MTCNLILVAELALMTFYGLAIMVQLQCIKVEQSFTINVVLIKSRETSRRRAGFGGTTGAVILQLLLIRHEPVGSCEDMK